MATAKAATPRKSSRKRKVVKTPPPTPVARSNVHVERANRYIDDVLEGRIPACKYVKLACQRQKDDLVRFKDHPLFYFDEEEAGRVCRFIELMPHVKGPAAYYKPDGTPNLIHLEGWQCFIYTTVYGWKRKDTKGRRFRQAYVEVPRGNAKSTMSSATGNYALASDHEEGAEIYSAATTREQASIVFGDAKAMLRKRDEFRRKLGVIVHDHVISKPETNSRFVPLSREAKSLDGRNVHLAIIDELHAHTTRDVYDVIVTAISKRLRSLIWMITTAGSDTSGICYQVRTYVTKILERIFEDESVFGIVYTIDEGDDWTDPNVWAKANPNWGVSVMPDAFGNLAVKAMQLPADQANFKTKHLNIWVNADQAWMDMRLWEQICDDVLDEADFAGDDLFIGLDLASKTDVAAKMKIFRRLVAVPGSPCLDCGKEEATHAVRPAPDAAPALRPEDEFVRYRVLDDEPSPAPPPPRATEAQSCADYRPQREAHYYGFLTAYVPEQAISDGRNAQYSGWEQQGYLKTTPGDVIDFALIKQDLLHDRDTQHLCEVRYDPWQANQLAQELLAEGFSNDPEDDGAKVIEVRATVSNFSAPMKEWDALVRTKRFHTNKNPLMSWMVSNVVCHTDVKENIYPRKERPENKIDGPVAGIIALTGAIMKQEEVNPYTATRGFRFL